MSPGQCAGRQHCWLSKTNTCGSHFKTHLEFRRRVRDVLDDVNKTKELFDWVCLFYCVILVRVKSESGGVLRITKWLRFCN